MKDFTILLYYVVGWQSRSFFYMFVTIVGQKYYTVSPKNFGEFFLRLPYQIIRAILCITCFQGLELFITKISKPCTVHVSGFGRSKAKTHLNIQIFKKILLNRIIFFLLFGKISSYFNDVCHPAKYALDQRPQVLSPQSCQARVIK